jgi:hypothetical protein
MATFRKRLSEFVTDRFPEDEQAVEALCRDNRGTYVIPYPCCRAHGEWRNCDTDETVAAEVLGWRPIEQKSRYRARRKK